MKALYLIIPTLMVVLYVGCKPKINNDKATIVAESIPMLPCKEFKVIGKNPVKRKVMKETIEFFLGKNCFINNRGIVRLYISSDKRGNEVWSMYSSIDNRHIWFEESVTPLFEVFDGDIVLIYKTDTEALITKMSTVERKKIQECIDRIIGDRVYERPKRKDRWTNEFLGPNNPNPRGIDRGYTGTDCKRRVVFTKDGSYKEIKTFY